MRLCDESIAVSGGLYQFFTDIETIQRNQKNAVSFPNGRERFVAVQTRKVCLHFMRVSVDVYCLLLMFLSQFTYILLTNPH
jgi:hypothetical protein